MGVEQLEDLFLFLLHNFESPNSFFFFFHRSTVKPGPLFLKFCSPFREIGMCVGLDFLE